MSAGAAGEDARVARLAAQLRADGVDALLVTAPVNVRYLTGFTGSNGLALVLAGDDGGADGAPRGRFFTDFRYRTQSAEQVVEALAREIVVGSLIEAAAGTLAGSSGTLGFDDAHLTVAAHARLREALPSGWELARRGGEVERLRAVKDEREVARMRAAAQLADEALRGVLEGG
ncbi:MAG TPA: aminopeptidase P family N-terminal domain-containing protein, partial [Solirubrobacteraceae bacterium]